MRRESAGKGIQRGGEGNVYSNDEEGRVVL
jgi:hypothetical protein